ncbi:hypothetical protein VNO78_22690 [Psophocarpus tetragonolobus]|uniref:Uncharacterized protein n=1 Tax=Psophocarpus tetragonolobus TaxID=3891 RepID=A0AAN9S2T5_PSOTE
MTYTDLSVKVALEASRGANKRLPNDKQYMTKTWSEWSPREWLHEQQLESLVKREPKETEPGYQRFKKILEIQHKEKSLGCIKWIPPLHGEVAINCDRSVIQHGAVASCVCVGRDGIIRDEDAQFLCGFIARHAPVFDTLRGTVDL